MRDTHKTRKSARTAITLTALSVIAVLIILILLLLKGGDRSFFAGVTVAATGAICACASLFISAYALRASAETELAEKKQFIACVIIDGLYIAMTVISLAFAWVLFSALGH